MTFSAARFVTRFFRPSKAGVAEREVLVKVDGTPQPALVFEPAEPGFGRPAWVLLHGMTVPGRHHAGVFRFGTAFAAAGAVVICPEIPEWTHLEVSTTPVRPTIQVAADSLALRPDVSSDRIAVLAFSIAVPAALAAIAQSTLADRIRGLVGFGASCDMHRTVRCMLTGEHEWSGQQYRLLPDPYGRWIVGANYLRDLSAAEWGSTEDRAVAADGLLRLAVTAGRNGAYSDDPVYDTLKEQLGDTLDGASKRLWSLLVPAAGRLPEDVESARALSASLSSAMLSRHADLDARPELRRVRARVHLVHGYGDQLVPFTETLRLVAAFPPGNRARATVTRLFGHARRESQGSNSHLRWRGYPAEVLKLIRTLRDMAAIV